MNSCNRVENDPRSIATVRDRDELQPPGAQPDFVPTASRWASGFRNLTRDIFEALRQDSRRAGDPLRHLRGVKMTEYRLYRGQLIVNYSVHDRIPMVTI